MALHTELDIYKPAYDLVQTVLKYAANMPRQFKRILGEKVCDLALQMLVLIAEANIERDSGKVPHLTLLLRHNRLLEALLRASRDLRLISIAQYAAAIDLSRSVGKQATKWKQRYERSPAV